MTQRVLIPSTGSTGNIGSSSLELHLFRLMYSGFQQVIRGHTTT